MYSAIDVELVKNNIDPIIDKIEFDKLNIYEPTKDQQMQVINVVLQYIKDKKRKVYGGTAQNKLVVHKNPKDGFYPEHDIPDIDFYSPEPLQDMKAICDLLYEQKIGDNIIEGKEAQHKETYTIFANYENACDISYVPKYIYNKIPFVEIDGIHYVHPSFIYIDLYRVLTEPHFSSRTWGKHFGRLVLIQKHYPFKVYKEKLNSAYDVPKELEPQILEINKFILNMIKNKDSYIVTGQYAYNYYLEYSQIMKSDNKIYSYINIPLIQIISTNYMYDAPYLISKIREFNKDVTFVEFYPFWQYTGYNVVAYYKEIPLIHITSHNGRCTPIQKVNFKTFYDNKVVEDKNSFVQLGSFDVIFLSNLISSFRCKVNDLEKKYIYHNIFTNHLINMKNYYFKKFNKNLLDATLFESFIPTCIGEGKDPVKTTIKERKQKILAGKPALYKYLPANGGEVPDFKFANTSGNPILNKNFKITKYILKPELLDSIKVKADKDEDIE
jgi:hypothetical protein